MLSDAISSEGYKLWRNRNALFWGFIFVPVVALITGVVCASISWITSLIILTKAKVDRLTASNQRIERMLSNMEQRGE